MVAHLFVDCKHSGRAPAKSSESLLFAESTRKLLAGIELFTENLVNLISRRGTATWTSAAGTSAYICVRVCRITHEYPLNGREGWRTVRSIDTSTHEPLD